MSEVLQKNSNDDLYLNTVQYYDHIAPYRARTDVAFYVDEAKNAIGPVLELGCGTGRILIPTAQAGIEITGLDASESMLARCREKLRNESVQVQQRVELIYGDMREFDL